MTEIWKDIVGYEGLYQVSNMGRVKSLNYLHTGKEKVLKLIKHKTGYIIVSLCKNGIVKNFRVHRLVWEAFKGIIPEGMQCNHLDENTQNNHLENLSLVTPKENCNWGNHNLKLGAAHLNHPTKSKPILQFSKDGQFVAEYPSIREAERQTGIDNGHIAACCKGKYRFKSSGGFIWKYKERED